MNNSEPARPLQFTCSVARLKMILLTHNMLISPMKGATKQLHLGIEAEETEVKEREFNQEFLVKMLERLEWSAFVAAAKTVSISHELFTLACLY
jgi:hypothetical protein